MARPARRNVEIEVGDIVLARAGGGSSVYALVRGVRLGRLVVERCDGRPSRPLAARDVVEVFKPAGAPQPAPPQPERLRPTAQLRMDLDG